jgi:hypothetical protein
MLCKYCHLNGHIIDKCPTIICKNCKDIGHPQWLCKLKKMNSNKNKKTNNSNQTNNINSIYTENGLKNNDTNIYKGVIQTIKKTNSNISLESKYSFTDEIKKKNDKDVTSIQKNINYYIKLRDNNWGDMINI